MLENHVITGHITGAITLRAWRYKSRYKPLRVLMRFASPSYLHRQGGIFHFRMSIPPKFRPMLGKTEVKRSLATPYSKQAGAKAMKLAVAVRGFLNHFDKVATDMPAHDFTPERLQALLDEYLREQLAEWETERATRDNMSEPSFPHTPMALR